jgi:carboxylesterase type B
VVFRGIPYAEPPIGARRFQPPTPHAPWNGARDCTAFGPVCPQAQHAETGGVLVALGRLEPTDEDCLFLNVWTPAVDHGRRPTMVWIHGGAYVTGSGSSELYDGAPFARDAVVMVSLNYRLHTLGFRYLDDCFDGAKGTGNLGILDQIAALPATEWSSHSSSNGSTQRRPRSWSGPLSRMTWRLPCTDRGSGSQRPATQTVTGYPSGWPTTPESGR